MTAATLTLCCFLFVLATVGASLLLYRWYGERRLSGAEAGAESRDGALNSRLATSMYTIGQIAPQVRNRAGSLRSRLAAAGHRNPAAVTVFNGIKVAAALVGAMTLGWVGLLSHEDLSMAVMLSCCGAGAGYLLPDRVLDARTRRRSERLERALPNTLDLLVLSVEAGQPLDAALIDASRELRLLYPELSSEFAHVQTELRAGRSRGEVLVALGRRSGSRELTKLATVLVDADRFGTGLGPVLRSHARYLRTRRRLEAQESARKLGVKLIFPVFFLIMPAVFVVTLGPAVLTFYEALAPGLGL